MLLDFQLQQLSKKPLFTTLSLLIVLSGCSTIELKDNSIIEKLNQVCLEGEGRGRINIKGAKHLFQFETAKLEHPGNKETEWLIAMQFAIHGEERLNYLWQPGSWRVKGSFLAALRSFILKSKNNMTIKELDQMLAGLGEVLRLSIKVKEGSADECLGSGHCKVPSGLFKSDLVIDWHHEDKNLIARVKLPESERKAYYEVLFSGPSSDGYKHMTLRVRADQGFKKSVALLDFDLYFLTFSCK